MVEKYYVHFNPSPMVERKNIAIIGKNNLLEARSQD